MEDYRHILRSEFARRKQLNGNYSLRAFSRRLAISPAQLSQLLSGKRPLSSKTALKIAERLGLSPAERQVLFQSLVREKFEALQSNGENSESMAIDLEEERFRVISDWYHFAMLSLFETRRARPDASWIAKRLGISTLQASQALRRLQQLQLVEIEGRRVRLLQGSLKVNPKHRSAAVVRFHQQILALASEQIESVPVEGREFRAVSLAVDPANLERARKRIQNFFREISAELESGEKQEVFVLSVQLFPVGKNTKAVTIHSNEVNENENKH